MSSALVCTSCGRSSGADERFCPSCGLPLVMVPGAVLSLTPAQERARKIRASYAEGPLVRVAAARHQAEAEFLQGLLLEEGIPSLIRRTGGFDVPDFLAAGPRDVLVPQSGESAARRARRPGARGGWGGCLAAAHDRAAVGACAGRGAGGLRHRMRGGRGGRRDGAMIWVRYVLPAVLVLAGFVMLFVVDGSARWDGFAMCVGAGLSVLLINVLFRFGAKGDEERKREDAAREYLARHGRWPDDE